MCGFLTINSDLFTPEIIKKNSDLLHHRGPDDCSFKTIDHCTLAFHRLSIMDTSSCGMQPFTLGPWSLVCNGEIYNYQALKAKTSDYHYQSGSDCEVLLPLIERYGLDACQWLDAEFAFSAYNQDTKKLIAARDPIGIRPLFYGYHFDGIAFASEAKALVGLCDKVFPFPPGHYYDGDDFVAYTDLYAIKKPITDINEAITTIHDDLIAAVSKRLMSDVELGFLLSGGLDSSLVAAIGARLLDKPIHTFAIGMDTDAIDLKYARMVAEKIGSIHHEVTMTKADVLKHLPEVIRCLETYDITTIRASMGMYLLCKYIRENTDIKVILTGEISDELFGYKYTDFAPNPTEFQNESIKRVKELYMYDVLRADRCMAAWSLEARVPFGDLTFANHVLSIDPSLKMNHYQCGKYLLRKAFEHDDLIPDTILWREKAAFSDAVGHSMVDDIKEYTNSLYPGFDKKEAAVIYPVHSPISAESLYYRNIFSETYPDAVHWIAGFWMPNQSWPGCNVDDPSARVLSNYGKSGE